MSKELRDLAAASKAAQKHASEARAFMATQALRVRDAAAPVASGAVHQVKRAGVYVGAFVRTLVGK